MRDIIFQLNRTSVSFPKLYHALLQLFWLRVFCLNLSFAKGYPPAFVTVEKDSFSRWSFFFQHYETLLKLIDFFGTVDFLYPAG